MASLHFIYTADWHLGSYRTGPDTPGVNGRLLDIQTRMREILSYAVTQKIPKIIIGGDVFRDRHPSILHLTIFAEFLREATRAGVRVSVIPGNHDQARMQGQVHALSAFMPLLGEDVNRHMIFDQTTMMVDWPSEEPEKWFMYFPYFKAPQKDILINLLRGKDLQRRLANMLLIMHGTVEGALAKNMTEYEIFDEDFIPYELVMGFKGVFAGHIHEQQHFNNVWYPGSIERLTFDDEGIDKYFLDVTFDDRLQLQVYKVPLNARKMMTLEANQMNSVQDGDIEVEGAIVRVTNANKNYVHDIKQVLADHGVYYVTSIHTVESTMQKTPVNPGTFNIGDFVSKYAEKTKYEGDVPKVTNIIRETLIGSE